MNYPARTIALPPLSVEIVRPPWAEDLLTFHNGRIARQFVLHFNITDFVMDMSERQETNKDEYTRQGSIVGEIDQLPTMREYLHQFLFSALRCQAIYTYSLAGGLIASDGKQSGIGAPLGRELRGPALQRLYDASRALAPQKQGQGQPVEGQEIDLPDDIAETLKVLGHVLRQSYYDKQNASSNNQSEAAQETPIAVILDYAEKLIPFHLGEGHGDREQLQALEVVQRWALDPLIRKTNNTIILLTNNIGQIPSSVYDEGSGCRAIRVPLPDVHEREAFIHFKMTRARPKLIPLDTTFGPTPVAQARQLARLTQGMRLTDIDNLSRKVYVEFKKRRRNNSEQSGSVEMKADHVQRLKSEVIQAQSAQLLEIVPPIRSFEEIGGLKNLKDYLRKRAALMKLRSHSPLVPSGLLLAGPPGTGKTIIAEALAKESGFNLVKMRNIQDKWIGSSERNLELVLNLLKDLYPVIVFVDEIDQAMVRRDTGQSGDSGVGARMFARILEEMSNSSNRGNILWIAATNRADIIDAALLRRFDRVVPLLVPDVEESCRIFATMVAMIVKQSGGAIKVAYGGDLEQSGKKDGMGNQVKEDFDKFLPVARVTSEMGITGAGIEIIVRRAIELAYEERYDLHPKDPDPGLDSLLPLELRHLQAATHDFKPNYNRITYDYQSLLAIRACNFYSVIPPLPEGGIFSRIQNPDGHINPDKLEAEISELERRLNTGSKKNA